jgi:hypothetical protein
LFGWKSYGTGERIRDKNKEKVEIISIIREENKSSAKKQANMKKFFNFNLLQKLSAENY